MASKKIGKLRSKLPRPKITFDRFGQIIYTFRETTRIALKVNPKLLISIFILNAIWGFSAIIGFFIEKQVIDTLIEAVGKPNWQYYLYTAGTLIVLGLLLSLFRNVSSSVIDFMRRTMSRYFNAELDIMLGKKLAELDMATIDNPEFQDKFGRIERESGRRAWGLMMPLSDIPNFLLGFISSVAVLILLNPFIAVGVLLVSLPRIFVNSKFIKKGYDLHIEQAASRRIWGWLRYYLVRNSNYLELKLLNLTDHLSKKLRKVVNGILAKQVELSKERQISNVFSIIPITIFELIVSLFLIFWVIIGRITVGSFQLYLRSLRSAQQNLTALVSSFLEIYENYIYVRDLVWFLDLKPVVEKRISGKAKVEGGVESIEFKNVWFKYQGSNEWILKGVNFRINSNERIALLGVNGAGKTTIIKLIGRFYDPQKGQILVNDKKLEKYDLQGWRTKLAVLFQRFEKYVFTARSSIGYGDTVRIGSTEEIKQAAKDAGADEFIQELPLKYKTPLTPRFEKGVRLSTGQMQRIGIARTFFRKDAELLILDEPTSNVDPEAEERIFKMLVKKTENKILIFVTQRFSTVRIADRILVVDKGKIIEDGTHKQLMAKNGKYAKLFTLQAQAYLN